MTFSILSAKLEKPQLPDHIIARTDLLKGCSSANVILVSAQAGSGKSTIVSAWLSEQKKPYCWYSLDEWDNDITQFLAYIAAGMKSIDRQAAEALEQLLDAFPSIGPEMLIRVFVTQLHSVAHPFIMVIDDYHVIQSQQIHQMFRTLLEHLPQLMQVILISREDPPFPLAKLRASKKLFELRISQLRFTETEVRTFFLQQPNLVLEELQLQHLIIRTEGWIAGLQLAALSMQGLKDVDRFIEAFTGSHSYIMDYLIEEVLDRQTSEMKNFLLKTSLFDYFSSELCETVIQLEPNAASTLIRKLVKTNCFIVSTDSSSKWYRYHPLFRELLRQSIEHTPKTELDQLHYRAGCWFKKERLDQEAIHHFLEANAYAEAAALIECKWVEMDLQLQPATWLNMVKLLPIEIIERSPVLTMGYGWALLDLGDIESCAIWFDKAMLLYDQYQSTEHPEGILINDMLQFELLPATIASARGYIAAARGDIDGIFEHTRNALLLIPRDQQQKRALAAMMLAVAHWSIGDLSEAEAVILQSLQDIDKMGNSLAYNGICMVLAELYLQQKRFMEANELLNQLIIKVQKEKQPIFLASLFMDLAKAAFLQDEYPSAYALLEESKIYGQKYALGDWKYKYYLLLARIYCNEGFYDLARDCIRESKANYFANPMPNEITFDEMETMIEQAEASVRLAQTSMTASEKVTSRQGFMAADSNKLFLKEEPLLKRESANRNLLEPLTIREMEVLSYIAAGLSNQEICNTLFLALNTVKGYNQTIYGKLQVKRRTEAVARAKELGIL